MNRKYLLNILGILIVFSCILACQKKEEDDIEEMGQQLGDTMASIDEVGGSTGEYPTTSALKRGAERMFARLVKDQPLSFSFLSNAFLPNALAGRCATDPTFSACNSQKITRTFGNCTVGSALFSGTVQFNFTNNDGDCRLNEDGESVSRAPNFTVTGQRGAELIVTVSGNAGQTITRTGANTFTFENDGIRRQFITGGGQTLFNFTTQTTSAITITGTTRSDRVIDGGTLRITHELASITCDVSPNDLTWSTGCNCAVSGNWSGTCSDGDAVAMTIAGCGEASFTKGDISVNVVFDRCY